MSSSKYLKVILCVLAVSLFTAGIVVAKTSSYKIEDVSYEVELVSESPSVMDDVVLEETVEPIVETNSPTVEVVEEEKPIYDTVVDTVFYGDSWMDNSIFKGEFESNNIMRVKGSQWAMYFVNNELITPAENAKCVFVQFGLNDWQTGEMGLTSNSYMKQFLDQLEIAHPNIPILITRSPHTGAGYVSMTGSNINPRCNRYSEYVKEYCDSKENYYYVDVTSCLEDENGWLKSEYVDSSTYHLTNIGYIVWFRAIKDVVLNALNNYL